MLKQQINLTFEVKILKGTETSGGLDFMSM
jgi:hypothetical protein